ncbi:MAG: tetratricopeptide repeat protein [Syntrophaceae bacterium]|nr:tetratricopeptide repeat protein [Syntrophaceae bacterium]
MAKKISTVTELFHRFHTCELQVKQGKIAACLINFKDVIERMPAIAMTGKEKKELHEGIQTFLNNLEAHKKFKEIFGEFTFGDTDLNTNLEFIRSMIIAQEQEITQKVEKDEEAAEAQRLEMVKTEEKKKEEINSKIQEAIALIDEADMSQALQIIQDDEEIKNGIVHYYNMLGIRNREAKNYEEAIKNYSKALLISPEDENLFYNTARAYLEQSKLNKAEAFLENALKLNPEFKEAKELFEYLQKVDQTRTDNSSNSVDEKPGWVFPKLLLLIEIIPNAVSAVFKRRAYKKKGK